METVIDELDEIRSFFVAAAIPGHQSIPQAIVGLRALLFAVVQPGNAPASTEAVVRLTGAMQVASHVLADDVEPHMRSDAVHLGMGAATHVATLLTRDPALASATEAKQALIRSWADHAALLAFELDALLRRRLIEARGDVFRRTIAIDRARATSGDGQPLH